MIDDLGRRAFPTLLPAFAPVMGPTMLTLKQLREHGLQPADVRIVPAAAGGPKGLILNGLDRFIFGDWLAGSSHPVHLLGASIGAWRMATACLPDSPAAFARLVLCLLYTSYAAYG